VRNVTRIIPSRRLVVGVSAPTSQSARARVQPGARSFIFELLAGLVALGVGTEILLYALGGPVALRACAGGLYLALAVVLYGCRGGCPQPFGWANRITLIRAAAVMLLAGAGMFPAFLAANVYAFAALAVVCLLLDGVDGWVARRTGCSGAFGARFDMELDAFFLLVLSVVLVALDKAGLWVLAIGLARYLFVIAQACLPMLRRPLPPSRLRKIACVWQGATLMVCLLPAVSATVASSALVIALALLMLSFGRDIAWLVRQAGETMRVIG